MGDKQGARLIRLLYARAYELPRVRKALGLGNFLDEKERSARDALGILLRAWLRRMPPKLRLLMAKAAM